MLIDFNAGIASCSDLALANDLGMISENISIKNVVIKVAIATAWLSKCLVAITVACADAKMLAILLKTKIVVRTRAGYFSQTARSRAFFSFFSIRCLTFNGPNEVIAVSEEEKKDETTKQQAKIVNDWTSPSIR